MKEARKVFEEAFDDEKMKQVMKDLGEKFAEAMTEEDSPFKKMAEAMKGKGLMLELKDKSDFEKELSKKEYPKAKAPEGSQKFRWDFSKKYKFIYDYKQKVKMASGLGVSMPVKTTATLSMNSKGNHTANMVLSDMSLDMVPGLKNPPVVVQGVTEDSKIPGAAPSQNELVKQLFPLPAGPLGVGESSSVPAQMPFNIYGSPLLVKGSTTITLKDYVTIDGHLCARFDVVIDILDLDVPEELTGEYKCSTKGVGVLYFDTEDRCFHSGEIALIMSMRARPGESTPMPEGSGQLSMDSDNFIRFTRNKEKEKEAQKK